MEYRLDFKPDSLQIHMQGHFTFEHAYKFRRLLSAILGEHNRTEIHLDISSLDFMDATATAMMMFAHDLAKKLHLFLVFERPQGQVREVLQGAAIYNQLNISH